MTIRPFLLSCSVALILLGPLGCEKQKKTTEISLINELSRARILCRDKQQVGETRIAVNGELRRALLMHPVAEVEFDLIIPASARLEFGMAMAPNVWQRPGDGVLFKADIVDGTGERETLFSHYINPKAVEPDRRWHEGEVNLSLYEGQKVTLILVTEPGPQNNGMLTMRVGANQCSLGRSGRRLYTQVWLPIHAWSSMS